MDESEKNRILVLSFIRRYGTLTKDLITGYDLNLPVENVPNFEQMQTVLGLERGIGHGRAKKILLGECEPHPSADKAISALARKFLPEDLKQVFESKDALRECIRTKYPKAWAEYTQWIENPAAYFKVNKKAIIGALLILNSGAVEIATTYPAYSHLLQVTGKTLTLRSPTNPDNIKKYNNQWACTKAELREALEYMVNQNPPLAKQEKNGVGSRYWIMPAGKDYLAMQNIQPEEASLVSMHYPSSRDAAHGRR